MPIQIFVSYARHDDSLPPDMPKTSHFSKAKGFVTFLHQQLAFELRSLGEPVPHLWRDTGHIERANLFDPLLKKALEDSEILLVVLSRNWLHRPNCQAELDYFVQHRREAGENDQQIRGRIVVVCKHLITFDERPEPLQGQEGYAFFEGEAGREQEYFYRGEIRHSNYTECVRDLASYLWREAAKMTTPSGERPPEPKKQPKPPVVPPALSGRTIFVAKPAGDMQKSYLRVVEELRGLGHKVVPPPTRKIQSEDDVVKFVVDALAQAEFSIHLLGEGAGFKAEDAEPIVALQLKRAAACVPAVTNGSQTSGNGFRRLIWAPKVVEVEKKLEDGTVLAQAVSGRDPLKVLARFDSQLPSDKIEGESLSKFVEFIVQSLNRTAPMDGALKGEGANAQVYIYHRPDDRGYAFRVAKALLQKNLEPKLPPVEGDAGERDAMHRQYLKQCDTIVLCWAVASDVWAMATANEWRNFSDLGRTKRFTCRGLVAGPPDSDGKMQFLQLVPKSEIDVVVDLTKQAEPLPDALEPIVNSIKLPSP